MYETEVTDDGAASAQEIDARGLGSPALGKSILERLAYTVGKDPAHAVTRDWCVALSLAVRDRLVDRWMASTRRSYAEGRKRVYYLSMEFLIGRLLADAMANLGITEACRGAIEGFGVDFDAVLDSEPDAALGNGGLGRLAACFLDSMSNLGIAGYGYGIRYEHGLFRQSIRDGWQVEEAEDWLTLGDPWEFERPEVVYAIDFGGSVEADADGGGRWHPGERVLAAAYDTPIAGWGGHHVNTLRLWSAEPAELFDLARFNRGEFLQVAEQQVLATSISRVLYPDDSTPQGQELRLKQEYFFTSASLQDLLRRFLQDHDDPARLPEQAAIQLNDTHPAIAVPELVRLLVDQHAMDLERAFEVTRACVSYTNHTLLPEALERWPRELLGRVLPRHLQIIEQINALALTGLAGRASEAELAEVSVFDPQGGVRMGNLAVIGSHKVNGVSALHSELMKKTVFKSFHRLYPERLINQTNGITPRRWLLECNPALAGLITEAIGEAWIADLEQIEDLAPHADDPAFLAAFAAAKRRNKERLGAEIRDRLGLAVDPAALFDVQIKRIHEYKRQLLNGLEILAHYQAIRRAPEADWQPRVKIFAGKAAPSYDRAKLIIKLLNDIARLVNGDPVVGDRLKVAFLPNYNVSLAEVIIPAADLSEQISTAGMEASGTGNMKLALNGALTLGTLDGANVEIGERVGDENIFIFGLRAHEVAAHHDAGHDPGAVIAATPALREAIAMIEAGGLSPEEPGRYKAITDDLRHGDYFLVGADFAAYAAAQREIDRVFARPEDWMRRALLNTARVGWFSADRTIRGYARDIWGVAADTPPARP